MYHSVVAAPAAGRGMELTAAGRAHVAKKKEKKASNISLVPIDVVNKEIAEKRRRDKARKYHYLTNT